MIKHNLSNGMIWYSVIWFYNIFYYVIYHDIISYDMIWLNMIWYDMIWYDMIWYDTVVPVTQKGFNDWAVKYHIIRTGEIMYGGHITDAWDRRTCNSYLSVLMNDQLFAGLELGPGFASPNPAELDYEGYITYVEDKLPQGVMKILWLLLFMFAFLSACLCLCLCLSMCLITWMCIFHFVHVCSGSMCVWIYFMSLY